MPPGSASSHSRGGEEPGDDVAGRLPLTGFVRELLPARTRQLIEARAAAVLGDSPLRRDAALLLEFQERRVQGSGIHRQPVAARLLDAARDAESMLRPERLERGEHHERERALPDVGLVFPAILSWLRHLGNPKDNATGPLGKQLETPRREPTRLTNGATDSAITVAGRESLLA